MVLGVMLFVTFIYLLWAVFLSAQYFHRVWSFVLCLLSLFLLVANILQSAGRLTVLMLWSSILGLAIISAYLSPFAAFFRRDKSNGNPTSEDDAGVMEILSSPANPSLE